MLRFYLISLSELGESGLLAFQIEISKNIAPNFDNNGILCACTDTLFGSQGKI